MLAGSDFLRINQADPRNNVADGNPTLLQHHQTTSYSHFKQPFGLRSLKENVHSHSTAGWSWIVTPQKILSLEVSKRQNKIKSLKCPSMQKKKKSVIKTLFLCLQAICPFFIFSYVRLQTNKHFTYKMNTIFVLSDIYKENLTKWTWKRKCWNEQTHSCLQFDFLLYEYKCLLKSSCPFFTP